MIKNKEEENISINEDAPPSLYLLFINTICTFYTVYGHLGLYSSVWLAFWNKSRSAQC